VSLNGSGVYSVNTAGQPVQSGTLITAAAFNTLMSDIATALSTALYKDGQQTATANQPMGGFKHTNVGDALARTQYASAGQTQDGALAYLTGVSGTNTILASVSPTPAAYAAGQRFTFIVGTTNTGAVTLNVSSLGAKAIKKKMSGGKVALVAADLIAAQSAEVFYDGTDFILETARTYSQGANIDSALTPGTINLDTATGDLIDVTGTTGITAITLTQGEGRTVRFTGILTLTNGASLVLPGSANITTAAGDFAVFRGYASGVVRCVMYSKVSGASPVEFSPAIGQCRLSRASSTSLLLSPQGGNLLKINGALYAIPDAGVTLAAAPGAANTTYYIYAYMSGATMTLEASATAWSSSTTTGNKGMPIKTGDDTRTLVGMARGNGSTQWADSVTERFVLNWWNRRSLDVTAAFTANRAYASSSWGEINTEIRNSFLTWADECVIVAATGAMQAVTAGSTYGTSIGIDGTTPEDGGVNNNDAAAGQANSSHPIAGGTHRTLTEGYHYATLLGNHSGGSTGNYTGAASGNVRCAVRTMVRG